MIEFEEKTEEVSGTKARNMLCDTIEIMGSVEVNQPQTKQLLTQLPIEILNHVRKGSELMMQFIDEEIAKR